MSTINEDVSAIKTIQDGLVNNKVARFSYTQKAYIDNIVDGVDTYNVNNEQNIPNGTADIMKVNDTIINKGYRAQASSITRMLMNHFLGRISYNLNKVNDNMLSLLQSITTNLGNVVNTGDSATPVSGGTTKFTTGGAYTELNKKNDKITITANETSVYDGTGVVLKGTSTETNPTSMEVRPVSVIWDYIKSKADSIYVKLSQLSDISGKANGIETLDANAKLPQTQLPDILGTANGIATLDSDGKLSQAQRPDISPDLSRAREIILAESKGNSINLITWNAEFDCWILEVQVVGVPKSIYLSINGNTDYTPRFYLQTVVVNGAPNYIYNPVFRCPYFVKKGTSITFKELSPAGSYIVVAPCMYVNA